MTERIILKGAVGYKPLLQGDLDGLCGVYAAINALRVVLKPIHPLGSQKTRSLMKSGIRYLDDKQVLRKTFNKGMTAKRQQKLSKHLTNEVYARTGLKVSARPLSFDPIDLYRVQLFLAIESSLRRGAALVVSLQNTHNHFTVVVGCSATRLYLADSDGLHWLSKSHFGPCKSKDFYRNCVCFDEILEISPP